MQRVVITGIGIVSCLGNNPDDVAKSLYSGHCGVVLDEERLALGFTSGLTGKVEFDATGRFSRKQRKTMPDFAHQACAAAMDAVHHAGLDETDLRTDRAGLVFGCDSSALSAVEQVDLLRERGETCLIGSGHVFRGLTSTITLNLNTLLQTKGISLTISSACASGGHAVGLAKDLIALGRQDRIVCGGAQEINWQSVCSFDALGAFSRNTDPRRASRPFDAGRDGLVPSGGAAALVLESLDVALARGATILGEVLGYGFSSDGENLSVPSGEGLARAMTMALEGARLQPREIDYINAHATSTPLGDAAEAINILKVFGESTPPVGALKSMTGHEFWMSGASQVVYSAIMARNGFMAPTINFETPDEHTARLNILTQARPQVPKYVMCNSAGFGGSNASLVLGFGL